MKKQKAQKKAPKFLANKSGGAMCAMSDDAKFGPVTQQG